MNTTTAADKRTLYKTARATISCAHFKAGDIVSVKYEAQNWKGTHYFICNGTAAYPEHHLADFVL